MKKTPWVLLGLLFFYWGFVVGSNLLSSHQINFVSWVPFVGMILGAWAGVEWTIYRVGRGYMIIRGKGIQQP